MNRSILTSLQLFPVVSAILFLIQPDGEDVFKMGRSTGKLFKEKGVSLYKDKEISTTHAKVINAGLILFFDKIDDDRKLFLVSRLKFETVKFFWLMQGAPMGHY